MPTGETRTFAAHYAMLPLATGFVEGYCAEHAISRTDALRLTLIVEELFTNSVTHGYRGPSDLPIRIGLSASNGEIALLYEDAAPPYDPLSRLTEADSAVDGDPASRPIGGLGIHLIGRLAARAHYVYEDGFNRLWLRLRPDA